MGFQLVRSRAVILAIGMLGGCTGRIVAGSSGTGGSVGIGTGTGGTGSATTGSGGDGLASVLDLNGSPQYYRFVRLTNSQWGRAVQDVLNLASPSGLELSFQSAVTGTTAFSNNELVLDVTQESWASFQSAAETLAAQVTATDAALANVYSGTDPAGFITTLGRRVYRRPLTSAEQAAYTTLYNLGSSLTGTRSTFAKGASLVIRAMLQSPYFLYRTEMGASGATLSGYEIAAKLSLWLRGTTPADTLLDSAAGPGKLDTADGAATLATTMLGETTATSVLRQFHGELLHFDRFAQITKVGVSTYNASLNGEFLDVSTRFFDDILTQGRGLKEILTSTTGYVGPGTASLYGLSAPASGYVQKDLGPQRVGWFAQVPYLALYGFNGDPDSIHRGVTLNLDMLCATLGPPAANLPPIPPLEPGETNRHRIDTLTSGCGSSCHNDMINPLGFSFEHFDGMGQFRDTENGGLTIDSSGSYTFADGNTKSWNDAAGLMQVLASTPQTHTCYAKKLASFGLQRDIVAGDMPLLNALTSSSMASTGSLKQMIVDLVRNDAFRTHVGGTP